MYASAVCGKSVKVKQVCRNRILEYDVISTCEDIVRSVSVEEEFRLHKSEKVHIAPTDFISNILL
jgi:hypothetical protein